MNKAVKTSAREAIKKPNFSFVTGGVLITKAVILLKKSDAIKNEMPATISTIKIILLLSIS